MDETLRKQITDANENHVQKWFEASGFTSQRLDSRKGIPGGSADWKFVKRDLNVICEVKTIFSGGQSSMTREQYERQRLETKRKFDSGKAQAIAEGTMFLVSQDELDYIKGDVPFKKQNPVKEEEFEAFLADIRRQLTADSRISQLPFSVSISIDEMYVTYGYQRNQFIEWLKKGVLLATEYLTLENTRSKATFLLRPGQKLKDGTFQRSIDAFVQVTGPLRYYSQLDVGFTRGGVSFNEDGIAKTIREAVYQLRASISRETTPAGLPWSLSGLRVTI